jgi:hypothetical protein
MNLKCASAILSSLISLVASVAHASSAACEVDVALGRNATIYVIATCHVEASCGGLVRWTAPVDLRVHSYMLAPRVLQAYQPTILNSFSGSRSGEYFSAADVSGIRCDRILE